MLAVSLVPEWCCEPAENKTQCIYLFFQGVLLLRLGAILTSSLAVWAGPEEQE